jgi:outer membrane protein assembly factor BamA
VALRFTGERQISADELTRTLRKVIGDQGYTDRGYRALVELNLRRAYENLGMYRVKFPAIDATRSGAGEIEVATTIEEDGRYTLGAVELIGDSLPIEAMRQAGNLKSGEVANWQRIQQAVWDMERPLKRAGNFKARSQPERVFHDERQVLDVRIHFTPGPLYRAGQLRVTGLPPTLEARIRSLWQPRPGGPFDLLYGEEFLTRLAQTDDLRPYQSRKSGFAPGLGERVMDYTLVFAAPGPD